MILRFNFWKKNENNNEKKKKKTLKLDIQYCRHGLLYFHATQWTTFCEDTRISTEHGGPLRNSPRTVFVVPIRSWIKTKHGTRCF